MGNTLRHLSTFEPARETVTGLHILALGLLVRCVAQRALVWPFIAFSLAVLLFKVPVVGRQLGLEALAGWLGPAVMLAALPGRTPAARILPAAAALLTAHALAQFEPGKDAATELINWIPFRGQVGTLEGMLDILETLWPFMALGLLARWLTVWRWRLAVMLAGGLLVGLLAFLLEWLQQSITRSLRRHHRRAAGGAGLATAVALPRQPCDSAPAGDAVRAPHVALGRARTGCPSIDFRS